MKAKFPLDKDMQFLICEDVRHEVSGKATLVGFYPGSVVVVHGSPPESTDFVAVLSSLSLVFVLSGGSGTSKGRVEIIDPAGEVAFAQDLAAVTFLPNASATVAGQLRPFAVKRFGNYSAVLSFGKKKYEASFELRAGDSTASSPPTRP
jgi:hypothetical protein